MTKCLTENCTYPVAPALKTGLCMRCHSTAKKLVEEGSVTWDELVGLGLVLSPKDAGENPFTVALNKRMEANNAVIDHDAKV